MSHLGGLQWIVLEDFLDIGWFQFVLKECVPVTWETSTVKYSILFYTPLIAREMYSFTI